MDFHPFASRFPMLEGEDYERFRADCQANGIQQPVLFRLIKGSERQGLDGRNRLKVAAELGIPCPEALVRITDEQAIPFIASLNIYRRHLTKETRTAFILEMRNIGLSSRTIADSVGTSQSTVNRTIATDESDNPFIATPEISVESNDSTEPEKKVTGKDGKTYKKNKKKPKKAPDSPPGDDNGEMVDEAGFTVPARLRAICAERKAMRSAGAKASRLAVLMKEVESGTGYKIADSQREERLRFSALLITLANLLRQIEFHSVHQSCAGAGCQECDMKGFLTVEDCEGANA